MNNRTRRGPEGPRVNEKITATEIRLIDHNGEMVGVINTLKGIQMAYDVGLDLVEVSPQDSPPVCKIIDYGKYKYQQQKKRSEAKKNQKVIEVKEVQFRPMIEKHDFDVKCRAIQRFLEAGNKVKVNMRFRGRELSHQELGKEVLTKVCDLLEEFGKPETSPRLEGRHMIMILAPRV